MAYIGSGTSRFNTADELTVTGNAEFNGNATFGDNDKVIFGAGSDLQIYHDGSNSYIQEIGTGNLFIASDANVNITNQATSELKATFISNGAVNLYYDNAKKLATTATGIDVTGTVTADGLNLDDSDVIAWGAGSSRPAIIGNNTTDDLDFYVNGAKALNISSGNDISFYADNGTTQGLFWDASTQRLGLGTTAPARQLHLQSSSGGGMLSVEKTSATTSAFVVAADSGEVNLFARDTNSGTGNVNFGFNTGNTRRMTIASGGSVGIGTSSPASNLHIYNTSYPALRFDDGTAYSSIYNDSTDGSLVYSADDGNARAGSKQLFYVDGAERMRIDASGNLLVGTTSTISVAAGTEDGFTLYGSGSGANEGRMDISRDSNPAVNLRRRSTGGDIVNYYINTTKIGAIGTNTISNISRLRVGGGDVHLMFRPDIEAIQPAHDTGVRDNAIDLGNSAARFQDIFATNGTIQTSDANEKQDIEELTDAEQRVAIAAKGLLRKYRWKDSVAEKGDDARIHFGIIAQDLKAAFEAEGLDAGRYAMFINSEWTDEETGEQKSRMGIRYNQLLAFIIAAI